MAHKEGNPHGCSKDGDLQSHPDRKNCTSVRLNQKSLSKLKCSSYLHLHLSEACALTGFDVLNTLYMHLIIISLKYNQNVRKKKGKDDIFSCWVVRRNLYFKASRHLKNYFGFPACTANWNRVCCLYAGGPYGKLEPLASREIMSPHTV